MNLCNAQQVTLVEIVLDVCDNTFGEAPCTASGTPCYNSWNTCRDKKNFVCNTQSYWFSTCVVPSHLLTAYTPNIVSVDSNPTTLEIGKTFSTRGRIKVLFQDDAHTDQGFDPYWPRGAIPICPTDMPGTLFGRWLNRVKYFENRRANVYTGFIDQRLCKFQKQAYFIDSFNGPNAAGRVEFILKDPLILADDKNAKCPNTESRIIATQTIGNEYPKAFKLGTVLDGFDDDPNDDEQALPYSKINTFLLANNYLAGDAAQDAFFARLRHVCIGKEVLEVRAEINNATPTGWNIRLVDRAACGSTLEPHELNASINPAETFQNQHVGDVVCRLLTECSEINDIAVSCCTDEDDPIIDFASFDQFRCDAPLDFIPETIICKPEGLTTLLKELSEQFLFFLYQDPDTAKIKIQKMAPPECDEEIPIIEECEVVKNSFRIKNSDDRYNVITYSHDLINCAESLDDENFATISATVKADTLRDPCERREFKTRKTKELKSRWINPENTYLALANGERWLMLKECPPQQVSIEVLTETADRVRIGKYAKLHHRRLQNTEGGFLETYWLLKGKANNKDCVTLTFERTGFDETYSPYLNCDACPTEADVIDECAIDDCVGVW